MKRFTLIIIALAMAQGAWAGDVVDKESVDWGDAVDALEYNDSVYFLGSGGETPIWEDSIHESIIPLENNHETEEFTAPGIIEILERCLEFVEDNSEDSVGSYTALAIYQPMDRESLQRRSIQEAQEHLKKLERETALRHDIERALKALKGE